MHVCLQRLRDGYHERHQEEQPRYRRRDDGDQQGGVPDPGLGYIKNVKDIENAVITVREGVPVRISDVAFVNIGPGTRRGGLDKEGVEAVGGVVVARYGSNPLEVINNVKAKIKEMERDCPKRYWRTGRSPR